MIHFRNFSGVAAVVVCLGFTGVDVAWGDSPRTEPEDYVEDPLAPHKTTGSTARLGTSVGTIPVGDSPTSKATALGVTAALGHRWGRFTVEAEYSYLDLSQRARSDVQIGLGSGSHRVDLGDAQRLGALARFDVIRLGSNIVGGNSMLAVYVEGGAFVAWDDWSRPANDEPSRIVPADTKRVEGEVGFGIMLDHRLQEPIGFPRRIGWFLGWRMAMAPHEDVPMVSCRGSSCKPIEMTGSDRAVDRSMLFGSSLSVTW